MKGISDLTEMCYLIWIGDIQIDGSSLNFPTNLCLDLFLKAPKSERRIITLANSAPTTKGDLKWFLDFYCHKKTFAAQGICK